jgi:CHAT domain-containing protein
MSTALLMRRFHDNLYKGRVAKVAALREAQLWLRDLPLSGAEAMSKTKIEELRVGSRMAASNAVDAIFALRQRGEKPFVHPIYWAAFQCVGADSPAVE